jgi:hypothetical protein
MIFECYFHMESMNEVIDIDFIRLTILSSIGLFRVCLLVYIEKENLRQSTHYDLLNFKWNHRFH